MSGVGLAVSQHSVKGSQETVGVALASDKVDLTSITTTRVSVASNGAESNNTSSRAWISSDGRYIAFLSDADNLVSGDTNNATDVFVHDRQTGQTTRVSVASDGSQSNSFSDKPSISADGRYVAFVSTASNLISGDTNGTDDIFVHDRQSGQTTRVSVATGGAQANNYSDAPAISGDGRYVAYESRATNLVASDTNNVLDIFVHDRQSGETKRVSIATNGSQGDNPSSRPSISSDGRYITFGSGAANLVSGDTNSAADVFVHDLQAGQTSRVSVSSSGTQGNNDSWIYSPAISADGRYVAFSSYASNLVSNDTTGNWDVFVRDRQTGQTNRVSVATGGTQGSGTFFPIHSAISADGNNVVFASYDSNLVSGDNNSTQDVFVHNRQSGETTRVSVATSGIEGNSSSEWPTISSDGRYVAFESSASNLVSGDTNSAFDIFVVDVVSTSSNTPPTANADVYTVATGVMLNGNVLENDHDADDDTLTSSLVSDTSKGILVLNSDGTFTYTPNANATGQDNFVYQVSDGKGGTAQATVTINIITTSGNNSPNAASDSATTDEDTMLNGASVLANDSDPDGDSLTVEIGPVSGPANGTLQLNADGTYIYTPIINFNGTDSFIYRVCDDGSPASQCAEATVTITVAAVNDNPTATNDNYGIFQNGGSFPLNVLSNDSIFPDAGETLSLTTVSKPSEGGSALIDGNRVRYTPQAGFAGSEKFNYTISDGNGGEATATVTITVQGAPVTPSPMPTDTGTPPCYSLTTSVNPSVGGTVTKTPAPNCPGNKYTQGTIVSLFATANAGYTFDGWSGSAGGKSNPFAVTMTEDRRIDANFIQVTLPTLTPMPTDALVSSVTVDKGEGAQYVRGEVVQVCFELSVAEDIRLQLLPKIGLLDQRYDYLGIDQTDIDRGCWPLTIDSTWIPGRQEVRLIIRGEDGSTTTSVSTWFTYKVDTDPVCESPDKWFTRQEWYENLINWDIRLDKELPLPVVKEAIISGGTLGFSELLGAISKAAGGLFDLTYAVVNDTYTFVTASDTTYDENIDNLRLNIKETVSYAKLGRRWSRDGERICIESTSMVDPPAPIHPHIEATVDQISGGYDPIIEDLNDNSNSVKQTAFLNIPEPEFLVFSFGSAATNNSQKALQNSTYGMYLSFSEGGNIGIDPSTGNAVNTILDAVFYESNVEQLIVIRAPKLGNYSLKLSSTLGDEYKLMAVSVVGGAMYEVSESVTLSVGQQNEQIIQLVELDKVYLPLIR